jgi:hypothetical protein
LLDIFMGSGSTIAAAVAVGYPNPYFLDVSLLVSATSAQSIDRSPVGLEHVWQISTRREVVPR